MGSGKSKCPTRFINLSNFTNFKIFADDASLFSIVNDRSEDLENLN